MAEPAKDQDQSMEDILQSIKRIIAEEGDENATTTGSDVLELTERLAEDGSVSRITPSNEPTVSSISIEDIMAAPISSAPVQEAPKPQPAPVYEAPAPVVSNDDALMSNSTLSASVAALNALRDSMTPSAVAPRVQEFAFRSGTTVEDLVVESLKPLLKEWLDNNLPSLVESLVKREISKLSQR